ncbi:MAG: hypothetical protein NVSMB3_13200 [Acidobacteriaceae bacterium]
MSSGWMGGFPARALRPLAPMAALAVLLAPWFARQASALAEDSASFRITGTVVNERTDAPVAHCHITATQRIAGVTPVNSRRQRSRATDDGPSAETDQSGRFSLSLPSAGSWQIYASGGGFRQQAYDRHENFFSAVVLSASAPTYDLVFRVEPDSAITGFVLDEAGEGVRNARISLRSAQRKDQELSDGAASERAVTTADDRGHYEFAGLAPGDYNIGVQAEPWYASVSQNSRMQRGSGTPSDPSLDVVYPQTWFPGVADQSLAEVISLRHGEEREADFNLTPSPATHLHINAPSPVIPGAQRGPIFPAIERISSDAISSVSTTFQIDPQGQIDIGGLSPGLYRVTLQGQGGSQSPAFIRIPSGAPRSLDLSAAIPLSSLTLHLEGGGDSSRVQVVLTDVETGATFTSYAPGGMGRGRGNLQRRAQPDEPAVQPGDRKLEVPPARYRVTLMGDEELYLASLSIKNNPLPGRIVSLSPGSTTLNARLTRGRASVRGVASLGSRPAVGAMVMLVPASFGQPESIPILRRDQTNTDGSFLIENVIPGNYILLAIQDGWTVNWRDPSTLERFLTHGVPVTLAPGTGAKQDLPAQTP